MNFLSKMFGKKEKKSNVDVYSDYASQLLSVANLNFTDANILKSTVYLCFAQIACIDVISKGKSRLFIDAMVEDAKQSVLSLSVKVKDLAISQEELERLLSDFPKEADVDENTIVNGLAAWNAIYFEYAEEIIVTIANVGDGPLGVHGSAAIKILEALRGKGESRENFMEVSFLLTEMTGEVIRAFR
jgi:hypothetical protein